MRAALAGEPRARPQPQRDPAVAARARSAQRLSAARPGAVGRRAEHARGWNFGPAEEDARPVGWIVERLARAVARRAALELDDGPHPHEARYLKLDSSRARARLGWRPLVALDAALDEHRRLVPRAARRAPTCARSRSGRSSAFQYAGARRMSQTACRFCGAPLDARVRRSRHVAAGQLLPAARAASTRWSRSIRCTRSSAATASWSSSRSSRRPSRSSPTTPTSRRTRRAGSSTPPLRRADDRALRARTRRARSSRSPPTTATCCSSSTSAGSRARHRAGGERRRGGASQKGIPTLVEFFGRETARARSPASRAADLLLGNNVLAHVPDLNDFVAGHEDPAQARRRDHDGVPPPDAADRGEPVRHDLPRALLLLLVPDRQRASSRRTACACSTSRSCRRTAARCASTAATPRTRDKPRRERRRASCASASARRGLRAARHLPRLRPARRAATSARSSSFLIELKQRGPARSPATARRRRATRCSTTAASAATSSTTPCDLNPHKQGHFLPGSHIPIRSPEAHPRGPARRRADPAVEPEGRDRRAARASSASGAGASPRARPS